MRVEIRHQSAVEGDIEEYPIVRLNYMFHENLKSNSSTFNNIAT